MPEYNEGPEAREKFEQTMRTLFQAPKSTPRKKKQGRNSKPEADEKAGGALIPTFTAQYLDK